jgi:hypothetical protein
LSPAAGDEIAHLLIADLARAHVTIEHGEPVQRAPLLDGHCFCEFDLIGSKSRHFSFSI